MRRSLVQEIKNISMSFQQTDNVGETQQKSATVPVSISGLENARKKLRALVVQKKMVQSSPLYAEATKSAILASMKKPQKLQLDPEQRRKTFSEIEAIKLTEQTLQRCRDLNIPLGLLPPEILMPFAKSTMPIVSMPYHKKLLTMEQVEELIRKAKDWDSMGVKIRYSVDKRSLEDPRKSIEFIPVRSENNRPLFVADDEDRNDLVSGNTRKGISEEKEGQSPGQLQCKAASRDSGSPRCKADSRDRSKSPRRKADFSGIRRSSTGKAGFREISRSPRGKADSRERSRSPRGIADSRERSKADSRSRSRSSTGKACSRERDNRPFISNIGSRERSRSPRDKVDSNERNRLPQSKQVKVSFSVPDSKLYLLGVDGELTKRLSAMSGICYSEETNSDRVKKFFIQGDKQSYYLAKNVIRKIIGIGVIFYDYDKSKSIPCEPQPTNAEPQMCNFTQQWIDYYRSHGMFEDAQVLEDRQTNQWVDYYRSNGMIEEALAMEQKMSRSNSVNYPRVQSYPQVSSEVSDRLTIPDKLVSALIGDGFEQITQLQMQYNCLIRMKPDRGSRSNMICTLTGTEAAVSGAKDALNQIMQEEFFKSVVKLPNHNKGLDVSTKAKNESEQGGSTNNKKEYLQEASSNRRKESARGDSSTNHKQPVREVSSNHRKESAQRYPNTNVKKSRPEISKNNQSESKKEVSGRERHAASHGNRTPEKTATAQYNKTETSAAIKRYQFSKWEMDND